MKNELQRADMGFTRLIKALTMTNIERANQQNRKVIEYQPCTIDAFFEPSKGVYNAIVSGGNSKLRISAMAAQAVCAVQNHFSVIVLHEGNRELENQLRSNFSGSGNYIEVNSNNPCFEPFYALSNLEIANQIFEIAPKEYDIKYNARYYIEGISDFLHENGKKPSFSMISTCPHAMMFDKVDDLHMQGKITDAQEQEIKSKLMMGQSENYKIDMLLASLRTEIDPILFHKKNFMKPVNIMSAVQRQCVLCFDIMSITNKLLINTLIYQLKLALTKGQQYTMIIDSIPIESSEAYASFMKTSSAKVGKMIASDDFFAMVGGEEKIFSTIVSDSQILVVMAHVAGHSATKWSEIFGQYDKYEESYSMSRGMNKNSPLSVFTGSNYQKSINIAKNREYIVKPEAITRMTNSEAYILSSARGELAHLMLYG